MRHAEADQTIFDVCLNEFGQYAIFIIQQRAVRIAFHLSGVMQLVKPVVLPAFK